MFDKLKQISQLKKMKDSLAQEKIEIEKEGIRIVLNGNLEIEEIKLNPDLETEKQEKVLMDCFNQGVRKIQLKMAERFRGMI